MMIQNLWRTAKAVLRGKFIVIQYYLMKQEKSQINNPTVLPKATRERTKKTQSQKERNHKDHSKNRGKENRKKKSMKLKADSLKR